MTEHYRDFAEVLRVVMADDAILRQVAAMASELCDLRTRGGRLFVLGVGGGASNAAHAVNDFRKLCGIEAYAPTDSVAELTARANDDGWGTIFDAWLETNGLGPSDALMVFSVGGGSVSVSRCIYRAVAMARRLSVPVLGIVGHRSGLTAQLGTAVVVVGDVVVGDVVAGDRPLLTPITETVQVAILHMLVSDPRLQIRETKW